MIYSLPLPKIKSLVLFLTTVFLVASCGSYRSSSYYEDDGIYAEEPQRTAVYTKPKQKVAPKEEQDGIYDEYFGQKAEELDQYMDSEIFTDPDQYSSKTEQDSLGYVEKGNYTSSSYLAFPILNPLLSSPAIL